MDKLLAPPVEIGLNGSKIPQYAYDSKIQGLGKSFNSRAPS